MKFGAHSFIFTERWTDERIGVLDLVAALGLDCFEIALGDDVTFTPALTRRRAEALGLTLIVSPGGEWPAACDLSADDPADRAAGLAWHRRQVDRAVELGAVAYTGALYGHPGTVKRRRPPADEYPRTAEGLAALAEYAAGQGVQVVIEPMSHFRTHLVNTPAQAMRLLALADHPNLSILLDTYHLITEVRDYGEAVRTVGRWLWGVHACENDRGAPGGGLVPWEALCAALSEVAFDGYVLLESYNSSLDDFAYRRGMFHNVCPDGEAFVRTGLAFLQKRLNHRGHDVHHQQCRVHPPARAG
ncbi:MAG: sugar phosphate isomerase/epimerase family protein [Anaerolineae bacterium]